MSDATDAAAAPPGGLIPHLTIKDGRAAEAIDFYKSAFRAEERMRHAGEDSGLLMHAHLTINGGPLMLNDVFPGWEGVNFEPSGFALHLQVDDADAWVDRAVKAGAEVTMPLENQFWGDRYGQVKDPFGFTWSIGGPVK
jgi:PhnB protein